MELLPFLLLHYFHIYHHLLHQHNLCPLSLYIQLYLLIKHQFYCIRLVLYDIKRYIILLVRQNITIKNIVIIVNKGTAPIVYFEKGVPVTTLHTISKKSKAITAGFNAIAPKCIEKQPTAIAKRQIGNTKLTQGTIIIFETVSMGLNE